jgi:hypothetical protein
MRLSYGNGGWIRVDGVGLPGPLYVRLAADEQGLKGAQTRSCSLSVLMEEAAEQVASVYNA